ncbi:NAD(P)/FAD-dependent oxidoreductase [Bradyrhizobium sp. U531]|uniref:NAD(P)/FAD-dependent oxidoreductase n=1 Tax=Bradyrhizobium sp. U531 TaxID=3053458 RepID=UPI003F43CFBE
MNVDVLIVGDGPAGLSAGLILGRCSRKVLICGDNKQRNRASHAIHGLLGREGKSPAEFLEEARHDLARYESVQLKITRVVDLKPEGEGFTFDCPDGTAGRAAKVLLATGLVDELPELSGVEELFGASVHHCLYCDGFEYSGKRVAAYGKGDKGADLALVIKHWTPDIVALSDGTEVSPETVLKLRRQGIDLRKERIRALDGAAGKPCVVRFESGPDLERDGLFFSTGCHQASELSERLGCRRNEKGGVVIDPLTEESSVPGVYVAMSS